MTVLKWAKASLLILERFNMSNCKPKAVPCELGANKASTVPWKWIWKCKPVSWNCWKFNLSHDLHKTWFVLCCDMGLSQHLSKPMKSHYGMAKQVLRYLKGTYNRCLKFVKGPQLKLVGYSDSDWAMSDDKRSISGYAFKLCDESSLISWKSK